MPTADRAHSIISGQGWTFTKILVALVTTLILLIDISVAVADETGLIEIYEHWNTYTLDAPPSEEKPIVLQVPEPFRYGSSKGATRNWGLNLLTFYPSFTSPQAPENAAFGVGCRGDCNGRILIAINYAKHAINNPNGLNSPNMGDAEAKMRLEKSLVPEGSSVRDLGSQYGFTRGYEVRIPKSNIVGEEIEQYLFRLSADEVNYDLSSDCSINKFARTCTLHFSLKCNPAIYVQVVAIDMKYIGEFMDVVRRTDQFVTSMVRIPACT